MFYVIALREHPARAVLATYLQERLEAHSFEASRSETSPDLIIFQANTNNLEAQAEHLHIRKVVTATGELQAFDVATRKSFANIDTDKFWLPFEDAYLTRGLLQYVRTDDTFKGVLSKLNVSLKDEEWLDQPLLEVCHRLKLVSQVGPSHEPDWLASVWQQNKNRKLTMFLDPIRNYFGEHVAFYFAWMNYMNLWLLLPAALSLAMWLWPTADTSESSVSTRLYVPLYSAFMVVWGILGTKFWRRTSHSLAWQWDTAERSRSEELRPAFYGHMRVSPVTGEPELYFKPLYRLPLYAITTAVTGVLVGVTLFLQVSMLNLQGVVRPEDEYFYITHIGGLSQPGQIFDPQGWLSTAVLIIRTVLLLLFKKSVYIPCVKLLTDMENHRTRQAHTNSLILKRYLYDAADRYVPLVYLALFRLGSDTALIQREFQMLYLTDTLRRLVAETLLPTFKVQTKAKVQQLASKVTRRDGSGTTQNAQAKTELAMPVYDEFNDFLEMVVEFGYITMFAAAYPPAAFISLLVNMVEVRSDLFKLTHAYRRPEAVRSPGIGTWQGLIEAQAWLSVLTNTVMVAFTGAHLARWLPLWFSHDQSTETQDPVVDFRLTVVLVAEHLLLLVMLVITLGIPDEPEQVRVARRRLEHMREQTFLRTQQQQRRGLLAALSLKRQAMEAVLADSVEVANMPSKPRVDSGLELVAVVAATEEAHHSGARQAAELRHDIESKKDS